MQRKIVVTTKSKSKARLYRPNEHSETDSSCTNTDKATKPQTYTPVPTTRKIDITTHHATKTHSPGYVKSSTPNPAAKSKFNVKITFGLKDRLGRELPTSTMTSGNVSMAPPLDWAHRTSVEQFELDCEKLRITNDRLAQVVSQNNANREMILNLEAQLAAINNNTGNNDVDFTPVNQALDAEMLGLLEQVDQCNENVLKLNQDNEILEGDKAGLENKHSKLLAELGSLESELGGVLEQRDQRRKSHIQLLAEIEHLEEKAAFDEYEYTQLENELAYTAMEPPEWKHQENFDSNMSEMEGVITLYKRRFGVEFDALMSQQFERERNSLETELASLLEMNDNKSHELEVRLTQIRLLRDEYDVVMQRHELASNELRALTKDMCDDQDIYIVCQRKMELKVEDSRKVNMEIKRKTENFHKMTNKSIHAIFELEHEILVAKLMLDSQEDTQMMQLPDRLVIPLSELPASPVTVPYRPHLMEIIS